MVCLARARTRSPANGGSHCRQGRTFRLPLLVSACDLSEVRIVSLVGWSQDVWDFQAKSGSSGSCRLFLHFLRKIALQKMSGKTLGSLRHPCSRHPRPSELGPELLQSEDSSRASTRKFCPKRGPRKNHEKGPNTMFF